MREQLNTHDKKCNFAVIFINKNSLLTMTPIPYESIFHEIEIYTINQSSEKFEQLIQHKFKNI